MKKYKSLLLTVSFALLLIILSYICNPFIRSIENETPPLTSEEKTALFYISSRDSDNDYLDLQYIGKGLINGNIDPNNYELDIDSVIVSSPNYTQYIKTNESIEWCSLSKSGSKYRIIGQIIKNEQSDKEHQWADCNSYYNEASTILDSFSPTNTYYFSSNGNDNNSGLSPEEPKKNPTDYLRLGDCNIMLKSGDSFVMKYCLSVGSNVKISTYGGSERALVTSCQVNSSPFSASSLNSDIYCASLDMPTADHNNIAWISLLGDKNIIWTKVYSIEELQNDLDFFVDTDNNLIYVKSITNIENNSFIYSPVGGFTFKDGNNGLIENIEIVGGGIGINVNNYSNLVCRNCYVHHVGGISYIDSANGICRYGNGIQVWANNTNNIYIYDNCVSDCFDAGISPQISGRGSSPSSNIYIFNNYIDRCLYNIEFFEHNRETTVPVQNVQIKNNILTNAMDITNNHRYATYGYTSYLCCWSNLCADSSFYICNNIGFGTDEYALAFYEPTPEGVNFFSDNTLIVSDKASLQDCIKNPEFYDEEDSSQILFSDTDSIEYNYYEEYISNLTSQLNTQSIFFEYFIYQ